MENKNHPSPLKALVKKATGYRPEFHEPIKLAAQTLRNELRAARISRKAMPLFESLKGETGLQIHLGCGPDLRLGWVNIDLDLASRTSPALPVGIQFINYDLRRGLPVPAGSCKLIYSSHFFEHLEFSQGLRLIRDCFRALQPGGIFRISLPNLKQIFTAYCAGDAAYLEMLKKYMGDRHEGMEALVDFVNYGVYQFGEHKCIYDEEKLNVTLREIGFQTVSADGFRADIDPPNEVRKKYSFHMQAIK
jgi:predicted SAM-dependent methyltransferase